MKSCPECGGRLLDDTARPCAYCKGRGEVSSLRYRLFGWPWYPWWPSIPFRDRGKSLAQRRAERLNEAGRKKQEAMIENGELRRG